MSYSKRSRYSRSPSPYRRYGRSMSRSLSSPRSRSRSRSRESSEVENPGNNLYVTGLSTRVTKRELEKHFASEGSVADVHLVTDPWTRESRGFGFVTMSTVEEANRCIKYLDRSVLEGRVITVEKVAVCSSSSPDFKSLTTKPSNQTHQANIRLGCFWALFHYLFICQEEERANTYSREVSWSENSPRAASVPELFSLS
ncbi:unnamed protein product, partial [Vitis vinifera]